MSQTNASTSLATDRPGPTRPARGAVAWSTVVPLAIAMAYADGFWMTSLRGAVGAIERTQGPFASWLRQSTLDVPLFALAVLGALTLALRRFGPVLSFRPPVRAQGARSPGSGHVFGQVQPGHARKPQFISSIVKGLLVMKSGKFTSPPSPVAKVASIAAPAHKGVGRVLALILVPNLAFLLGVGLLAPAAAVSASATPSLQNAGPIPTQLLGFNSAIPTLVVGRVATTKIVGFLSTPIAVTVGRVVTDDIVVLPRASRLVQVQVRRTGARTFVKTATSGRSSKAGAFRAVYRPTAGVWQYRLVVLASATARSAISPIRTVTAKRPVVTPPKDTTAPGPVTALTATAISTTSIKLDWANPSDADFTGVTIRRAAGSTAPRTTTDGSSVPVTASATARSYADAGLNAGTQYSYAVFAHDRVPNYAAAANVAMTTTTGTTAALVVNSTRATVGLNLFFDPSSTYRVPGATMTETLDYGDGTPAEANTGDPAGWFSFHSYATTGAKTATLTVTDSAKNVAHKVVTINAYDPPTAAIPATGQAQVGVPFTFPITATTPAGTAFQSWNLYGDWLAGGYGAGPPATLTHTFMEAGVHTFTLTVADDAQGTAVSSEEVVTVQ